MKAFTPILLTIFLFTISCDDELPNPDPIDPVPRFTLRAGDSVSDSVKYYEFNPTLKVKGFRTGDNTNYSYHDSALLDPNDDGLFDLHFEYYMYYIENICDDSLSNDSIIYDCFPDAAAYCYVKTGNNTEIAMEESNFVGRMPKIFETGEIIDQNLEWTKISREQNFSLVGASQDWDTDNIHNYMGFRIIENSDTIFGWIRLNTNHSSSINIYDYAIEK